MINKKEIILIFFSLFLFLVQPAHATVLISDRFDDQADWVGNDGGGSDWWNCIDPPAPWDNFGNYCSTLISINSSQDAHGSGKSLRITWPTSMTELGLQTPKEVVSGKQTVWVGFWWKHDLGWDWGGDQTHKWVHGFRTGGNESFMINFDKNHRVFFDGAFHLQSNIPFDSNDDSWHKVVIKFKHSTGSNLDGELRMLWDDEEVSWTFPTGIYASNTALNMGGGDTWNSGSRISFGLQSRPDWGSGNISYFDDIIIATTQSEVTNFLGGSSGTPLVLQDVIVDGPDQVNENNTAGYTATAVFTDSSTQDVSAEATWTDDSSAATMNGSILSTSSVAGDQAAIITASYSLNGVTKVKSKPIVIKEAGVTVFMDELFNDTLLDERDWYDAGAVNQVVEFDVERQENVLRIDYPAGSNIPSAGTMRHLFPESENIHIKYFVKYSSGWAWSGLNFGPHEFYLLTNADHQFKGPASSHLTFYIEMLNGVPRLGIQDSENIDVNSVNQDLTQVTENRSVAGCNGSFDTYLTTCYSSGGQWFNGKFWDASISPIKTEKWYAVDVYARMNSIVDGRGVPDGVVQYFLDGELLFSLKNILFRTGAQPNLKFNQIMIGPYFENPVATAQSFWIDNLQVDTGDTIPPANPFNLK